MILATLILKMSTLTNVLDLLGSAVTENGTVVGSVSYSTDSHFTCEQPSTDDASKNHVVAFDIRDCPEEKKPEFVAQVEKTLANPKNRRIFLNVHPAHMEASDSEQHKIGIIRLLPTFFATLTEPLGEGKGWPQFVSRRFGENHDILAKFPAVPALVPEDLTHPDLLADGKVIQMSSGYVVLIDVQHKVTDNQHKLQFSYILSTFDQHGVFLRSIRITDFADLPQRDVQSLSELTRLINQPMDTFGVEHLKLSLLLNAIKGNSVTVPTQGWVDLYGIVAKKAESATHDFYYNLHQSSFAFPAQANPAVDRPTAIDSMLRAAPVGSATPVAVTTVMHPTIEGAESPHTNKYVCIREGKITMAFDPERGYRTDSTGSHFNYFVQRIQLCLRHNGKLTKIYVYLSDRRYMLKPGNHNLEVTDICVVLKKGQKSTYGACGGPLPFAKFTTFRGMLFFGFMLEVLFARVANNIPSTADLCAGKHPAPSMAPMAAGSMPMAGTSAAVIIDISNALESSSDDEDKDVKGTAAAANNASPAPKVNNRQPPSGTEGVNNLGDLSTSDDDDALDKKRKKTESGEDTEL